MKTLLFAGLLLLPFIALQAQPAPAAPVAEAHEETELDGKMDTMRGAFNKLRKQVADPAANPSSLELVSKLKKAAEASLELSPARAADVPEAERAAFVEAYKTKMKAFIAEVDKLEVALKADKNEEASAVVARLGAMQKEGHREFRRPESKK
jgi:hypothetical protein